MWKSRTKITEIVNGKEKINTERAILLEEATWEKASEWLALQQVIDLEETQEKQKDKIDEVKWRLKLYENFPIQELVRRGILTGTRDVNALISQTKQLFGITNLSEELFPQAINYRKTDFPGVNKKNLGVWLKLSEIASVRINSQFSVPAYDEYGLTELLKKFSGMSTQEETGVSLIFEELRKVWVIVVVLKHFEKTKIDGACYWNEKVDKPVVVLSLRYHRLDNFWFTLSHEIGHIIKHKDFLKANENSFIEFGNIDNLGEAQKQQEVEADKFAQDVLIDEDIRKGLIKTPFLTPRTISFFSTKGNVHPAILIWRLKFENILPYGVMSRITNKRVDDGIPKEHTMWTL